MQVIAVWRIGETSTPTFALDLAFQIGSYPKSSRWDLVRSGRSLLLRSHDAGAGAPVTILDSNVTAIIWPRIALDRVRKAEQPELCLRLLSIQTRSAHIFCWTVDVPRPRPLASCAIREMIQIAKNSQIQAPTAYTPTSPRIHNTKKITANVHNIFVLTSLP